MSQQNISLKEDAAETASVNQPVLFQLSLRLCCGLSLCLLQSLHHRPQQAERERKREKKKGEKEEETISKCLKTLSGKYLAPKLISLFDHRQSERGEEREREI